MATLSYLPLMKSVAADALFEAERRVYQAHDALAFAKKAYRSAAQRGDPYAIEEARRSLSIASLKVWSTEQKLMDAQMRMEDPVA